MLNALYFSLSWIGYHIGGTYYIEGGYQALSNAFRNIILENGGKVVLNEEIIEVISEENSIKSVKSSKGNIYSGDIFILNGSPLEFVKLINNEKMIDRIEKELSRREVESSLTQLYVGLDVDPTELGLEKADYFILGNEEEEYGYKAVLDKEFDKIPFNVVNYNILDPNFNKDTGVIAITIPDIYDNWKDMEREEYLNQKREVTQILLNRVYKYFPKIKEHIVLTELGTPLTMKRYTNNTEGAVYGFK